MYGKLDFLPWQDPSGNPYDHKYYNSPYLERSAKGIKIMDEIDDSTKKKEKKA